MKQLAKSDKYIFSELESYLFDYSGVMLRLFDPRNNQHCFMWCFHENFSKEYQSGDCVLFYDDGETHSANPGDDFIFKDIIHI